MIQNYISYIHPWHCLHKHFNSYLFTWNVACITIDGAPVTAWACLWPTHQFCSAFNPNMSQCSCPYSLAWPPILPCFHSYTLTGTLILNSKVLSVWAPTQKLLKYRTTKPCTVVHIALDLLIKVYRHAVVGLIPRHFSIHMMNLPLYQEWILC